MRLLLFTALALVLAGCSSPPPPIDQGPNGTVTVFAAASLTDSFDEIADAFAADFPDVTVVFNFGGSSTLATQIIEGAPADVYAAASPETMQTVWDAGLFGRAPTNFATNRLAIAVAEEAEISGLDDFADPTKLIAVCAVEVPCGAAAATLFANHGISPSVDTYEQDVRAVLTKVELGEVDAGLVYVTDIRASGVDGLEIDSTPVTYSIATVNAAANKDAADAFVAFVLSPAGQAILKRAGFGTP